MRQDIRKFITPASYLHRWKKIRRSIKVSSLKKRTVQKADFIPLWKVKTEYSRNPEGGEVMVGAFGIPADSRIDWMKDVPGNHVFPCIRIDKLKMSAYYDRGIDVKYPWELSRFIFGNELAALYAKSGKTDYYARFKELVLDWIQGNPFLMGVNWACTMDVAIRATNWILAANAFAPELAQDEEFSRLFSESLVEHGMYIHAFPEIYPGNHTTNHTTADYVGLLYVARALRGHPDSSRWQQKAIQGLISCLNYQVYEDGGSFEASAGYHRLVTELFGLGALLCLNQAIPLPEAYFLKLHSMFGFLFSLCDMKGNAPLFGDNDSGTLLQFDFSRNQDYSYMKVFYTRLFPSGKDNNHSLKKPSFLDLMPADCRVHEKIPFESGLERTGDRLFRESGIMVLRRGDLFCTVHFTPIGQKGRGGHNHLDAGSFTLSHMGRPIVVDPGTYTYTRDVQLRNRFRAYSYHNTVIPVEIGDEYFVLDRLFELDTYYKILSYSAENEEKFSVSYSLLNHPHPISREFHMEEQSLNVTDTSSGHFVVNVNLAPGLKILDTIPGQVRTNLFVLSFDPGREFQVDNYDYAARYQTRELSQRLSIHAKSTASMRFDFKHGT